MRWLVTRISALDDMKHFYEPDLMGSPDSPFIRDGNGKLCADLIG
jgi:hypothetical protein